MLSCSKTTGGNFSSQAYSFPVTAPLPESRINDWAYGSHPLQTLDLFLPYGRNKVTTKLLVLVHGGQWVQGDKSDMEGYISLLKSRLPDFAFASINYRLIDGSGILLPMLEQDISAALSFLWAKTDSLKISNKTVLMGESAGGQLALINAYKLNSSKIKAAIGFKSPTHLVNWYNRAANPQIKPMLEFITGGTPLSQSQIYFDSSPINFVNTGDPATLLIHGDGDGFVLTEQATGLSSKLDSCGVIQQLILFPGEAHAFTLNAQLQVYDLIAAFLSDSNLYK
jgi:acetyl esterase/lipase